MKDIDFLNICSLIAKKIKGRDNLNEETLRFLFITVFAKKAKIKIKNIVFEEKYNSRSRTELDAHLMLNQINFYIEFKCHKNLEKSSTSRTGNFGLVINDLIRLYTKKSEGERYLVYCFGTDMNNYYEKRRKNNKFSLCFDSPFSLSLAEINELPQCAQNNVKAKSELDVSDCFDVKTVFSKNIDKLALKFVVFKVVK